jgi:hypothetical protein
MVRCHSARAAKNWGRNLLRSGKKNKIDRRREGKGWKQKGKVVKRGKATIDAS